jgi:uncharacterized protein
VRWGRRAWTALGLLFVASGLVGVVVPGWPTTVWLILALFCFKKGSARLEAWLLGHRLFGPTLRDWDENKWMSVQAKAWSCSCIALFSGGAAWALSSRPWVVAGIAGFGLVGIAYILTRRTKPKGLASATAPIAAPVPSRPGQG